MFQVPDKVRQMAVASVDQARKAFETFAAALQRSAGHTGYETVLAPGVEEISANDSPPLNWSTLKYVFGHGEGGSECRESATSRRRSSRSNARSMSWFRRVIGPHGAVRFQC